MSVVRTPCSSIAASLVKVQRSCLEKGAGAIVNSVFRTQPRTRGANRGNSARNSVMFAEDDWKTDGLSAVRVSQ